MHLDLTPLNRRVVITPGSNLLDILREHQIPVSWSCMAGRCQTCRCQVLSGHVEQQLPEDAPELGAGEVLACCTTLHSDSVVQLPDCDDVVVHPARTLKTTVTAFTPVCHDVWLLRLRPAKPFSWSAGQFVRLTFPGGGQRSYSMASTPEDDELEFHIRIVPDGRLTPSLPAGLKTGDSVKLSGPLGASWLRLRHDGPLLCVASGTGLAPQLSIIRTALATGVTRPVTLYYGARREEDLYGVAQLEQLARDYPGFRFHVVLSQQPASAHRRHGRLPATIAGDIPSLAGWKIYPAGNPAMVASMTELALQLGARPQDIHADAFYFQP
ncbi:2Fe-2S iron-sulfur cluster-binding protein [Shimwellia blattae]|uniref:Naphthalene 1,2-dioxygenase system ferredoxin--NAD(+) reductase component n=1 Tax=Shimwellia blattae (strain ATCC 29907 / DSM 4481 / JCM 1650 / NBRC 105725 / CDC 9005-74) TaxID=630626 RepID=I2BD82_SHIBC|nr:2Fe-2S iron-sulfur cluster-binding protein [Shimwellia blattae]AFJ48486.1 naphthalene 1,2-dioxygenase system ferredoxin--NAD(+) reductase component [Shimwellia blattae DSM 4481 = NBRC 105725]GAB82561.1 putative reductase [Shimwellia blattae DSM 4481 = NBRC 105725]VDY65980.1 Naphthalene 1,2-dioxygenase system ferredoxin--NAD(+) reductase component [Shimwellia blattae]VEC26516.1 Naphthalene 1,2-dioxygenase system ferredoxin--NAD(+) reductase component [Shimwellia blattae]